MRDYMVLLAQADDARYAAIGVLVLIGGIFVVVWMISFSIRSAEKHQRPIHQPIQPPAPPPPVGHGFPVKVITPVDGPGRFRVIGVDRESTLDVTDYITADSEANAKVKAELRGIVVTRIDRV